MSSSDDSKKKSSKSSRPMSVKVEGKRLIIDMPLDKPKESASGKTMVVASTRGNKETEAQVDGHNLIVGLNVYYYND